MNYRFYPIFLVLISIFPIHLEAQCLTLGADLSYVNSILKKEGIYRNETGDVVDPFEFFGEKGTNMARLRLWHTPSNIINHCGNPIEANSLEDVLETSLKIVDAGMEIMLAIHYGDYFNDPGKQKMPAAWMGSSHEILLDSIYQYTYQVLQKMHQQGTTPSIVGIGNETTWGFIDATSSTNGWQWPQDAEKFNTAFQAVDDFNQNNSSDVKKAVHFIEASVEWLAGLFEEKGINNFDIIGFSYYPSFSAETDLDELGGLIQNLATDYDKEVMIFETGFVWKINGWVDSYTNILNNNGNVLDFPASPEGQKDYLLALCQSVYDHGGTGVFYWEPGYISSDLCTKWGQGSPYENVCFFDYRTANSALPAFDFFRFCDPLNTVENINQKPGIFPNPVSNGKIHIKNISGFTHWEISDIMGTSLCSGMISTTGNSMTLLFDNLNPGIYCISLFREKGQAPYTTVLMVADQ